MALTTTSLNGAITASQTFLKLTSATPATGSPALAKRMQIQVDGEKMLVTNVDNSPTVSVVRGYAGTLAVAHNTLAPLIFGQMSDWNDVGGAPVRPRDLTSISVNGVIPVPTRDTLITLDKATALTSTTLGAPSPDSNGITVQITSTTAAAHVITATALLADAASGSPEDTATFDAFIGATLTLVAQNGLWNVVGSVGVVIT